MPGLALLSSPLVRGLILAGILVSGLLAFGAYQRHVGKAEVRAEYEKAAQVERDRQMASLEATQARARALVAELAKTKRSRDAMVQQNDALASTLDGARCLDAGSVLQLNRVH